MDKNTKKPEIIFKFVSFYQEYKYNLEFSKKGPIELKEFDIYENNLIENINVFLESKKIDFNSLSKYLEEEYKLLNFSNEKTIYFKAIVNNLIPKNLKYFFDLKKLFFVKETNQYNSYLSKDFIKQEFNNPTNLDDFWELFPSKDFIKILKNLKECLEWSFKIIDFEFEGNIYNIDLSNEDNIKYMFKEFKQTILNLQKNDENNKEEINKLTIEFSKLKDSFKELNKQKSLEELNNLKENIIESLISFIPFVSNFFKGYKVIKGGQKLLNFKKETIKEINN